MAPAKKAAETDVKPVKAAKAASATSPAAKPVAAKPAASKATKPAAAPAAAKAKPGKDFDAKFLAAQRELLLQERTALSGQATRLEDEANSLIEDQEMGDVEFGEEGGQGDTMVVERERDLALSAQARQMVVDIDAALERLEAGIYGYSVVSGKPIPRERLEAIPWASVLVEEKVGGIGRR